MWHNRPIPQGSQPLALWTSPLAQRHSRCLDKLTIDCPCFVCVTLCGFCLSPDCVCASLAEWIDTGTIYKTFIHVRAALQECAPLCVCVHFLPWIHVQLQSSLVLVCTCCGSSFCPLFIKKTVGGYWAFPITTTIQNTKLCILQFIYWLPLCAFSHLPSTGHIKALSVQMHVWKGIQIWDKEYCFQSLKCMCA